VGELGDDGLPEPLQFEISVGCRDRAGHRCRSRRADASRAGRRAKIVIEPGNQKWGYAGAFADPDGHMWQVSRADGFLTR
jgi:uncharacterized protein